MQALLDQLYRQDLHAPGYIPRKQALPDGSFVLHGMTLSGKTMLLKHYLLQRKKATYLYVDCSDVRLDVAGFNAQIALFCREHAITTLVLDNYDTDLHLPTVAQIILSAPMPLPQFDVPQVALMPLDFEEFLAFERRYDESALADFLKLGGLPVMHKVPSETRALVAQRALKTALSETEFALMLLAARLQAQKVSAHLLYDRLKAERRIAKDTVYRNFDTLQRCGYLYTVGKHAHPRAARKLYLGDVIFKTALSDQKNFARLFENFVLMELIKHHTTIYYEEAVDFYLEAAHRVVLCMPFAGPEALFGRIERIEAFVVTHQVYAVDVVTMSIEAQLEHPLTRVQMIPFSRWALGEEEGESTENI